MLQNRKDPLGLDASRAYTIVRIDTEWVHMTDDKNRRHTISRGLVSLELKVGDRVVIHAELESDAKQKQAVTAKEILHELLRGDGEWE